MPQVVAVLRKGRAVHVTFDDGSELRCDRDFLPAHRLTVGQQIEPVFLDRLARQAGRHDAERLVLRWLANRPRSRVDLQRRLRNKGVTREVADDTLSHLAQQGYLDDHAFASAWVESRLRAQPRSQRMIRSELRSQGVDSGIAEEVTRDIDDDAAALAIAVGQRARVRLAPVNDDADREDWGEAWEAFRKRTGGLLLRRGFASGTTQRALRAAWAPPAPILHVVPSDPTITLV
ncbi:MAG: regulatory protein [Chloroflexi bacterium]|jgi:regulatory protein|nr:MAG: regulatory protein [Chloroflexota bacterium]